MNKAKTIELISKTYGVNVIGDRVPTYESRSVFATLESIGQREFFLAGEQGFKAEGKLLIRLNEYEGEERLLMDGYVYTIYRTFDRDDGRIEIYLTDRVGNGDLTVGDLVEYKD